MAWERIGIQFVIESVVEGGETAPALVRGTDGHDYYLKFYDPVRYPRECINELFAAGLGRALGLAVPEAALIAVEEADLDDLRGHFPEKAAARSAGLHFGSRKVVTSQHFANGLERWPAALENPENASCTLPFDGLICNADRVAGGNYLITRTPAKTWRYHQIDHGRAGGSAWLAGQAPNLAASAPPFMTYVYQEFQPIWRPVAVAALVSRFETYAFFELIDAIAATVPAEWGFDDATRAAWVTFVAARCGEVGAYMEACAA